MSVQRQATALLLLLVIIFAFWWGVSVINQNSAVPAPAALGVQQTAPVAYSSAAPVAVHGSLSGSLYTYSGSLTLPAGCNMLGSGISAKGFSPAHITILLTLTALQNGCVQASGTSNVQPFSVSLSVKPGAPKPVLDGVTVNGSIIASKFIEGM